MQLKRIVYVLVFLLITLKGFSFQGFYQNLHAIYSTEQLYLEDSKIYTITSADTLDLNRVMASSPSAFTRLDRKGEFLNSENTWAYFQLVNKSNKELEFILEGGRNAQETYYVVKDSAIQIKKAGYYFSSQERDVARGYTTKISLTLEPEQITRIYVEYNNPDGLPINVKFRLKGLDSWLQNQRSLSLFEGIFMGVIVLIIALNFFIYGFTKLKVFFLFAAYASSNLLYFFHIHGNLELLLYPSTGNGIPWLWLLPFITAGTYFLFTKEFLELKQENKLFHKTTSFLSYGGFVLFLLTTVYLYVSGNVYVSTNIMYAFVLASAALAISLVIYAFSMKSVISNYFAVGTLLFMITVIVAVVNQLMNVSNAVPVFVQIGIIIEVIVFSIGISHKLKKDFDNHLITQQSLILQLTKADKIQKSKTQELEEQVADRTQQIKEQNTQLEEARSLAETATKAKSDFLSVMSHEIRTPLNAIISLSHIMDLDNKDEEMSEYIDALKFSAEGLHSLINDILDYNKIEAGKLKLESIEFSLIDLMRNVRDSFKYKANSKGVELQIEVGEHLPDQYLGDPTRLTQIFNNLISNGIKFTEEGHVRLKAELLGIKDNIASLRFDVTDTGIGIPQDRLESIFEEFEQASTATSRNYGGTGLGLSITQKLLDMMESKIIIKSKEGQGSSFSFDIDFEICQEFDLVNLQLEDRDKDLAKSKIMVVDDNDMNRLVLKRLLDIWNAEMVDISNGTDAISYLENRAVDLVLMDLQMQPLDGFETTAAINKSKPDLPIIAMSANQPHDFEEEYFNTGFSGFVNKPFDPEDLYTRISNLITKADQT